MTLLNAANIYTTNDRSERKSRFVTSEFVGEVRTSIGFFEGLASEPRPP